MAGFVPVARFGRTPDHKEPASGRYVAESAFWTPAALLAEPDVRWEADILSWTERHPAPWPNIISSASSMAWLSNH